MSTSAYSLKRSFTAGGLVLVIVACWAWIYLNQSKLPLDNVPLHQGVGEVLAEQTIKLLGSTGQIIIVAIIPRDFPELTIQLTAFEKALQRASTISIQQKVFLEPNDPKYGLGRGLSPKRLLQIVQKHPAADAIVSFIGAPNFADNELEQMAKAHPKFLAETHSAERTLKLLEKGALHVAIVPRMSAAPAGSRHPHTPRQWFDRYFQLVTPATSQPQ